MLGIHNDGDGYGDHEQQQEFQPAQKEPEPPADSDDAAVDESSTIVVSSIRPMDTTVVHVRYPHARRSGRSGRAGRAGRAAAEDDQPPPMFLTKYIEHEMFRPLFLNSCLLVWALLMLPYDISGDLLYPRQLDVSLYIWIVGHLLVVVASVSAIAITLLNSFWKKFRTNMDVDFRLRIYWLIIVIFKVSSIFQIIGTFVWSYSYCDIALGKVYLSECWLSQIGNYLFINAGFIIYNYLFLTAIIYNGQIPYTAIYFANPKKYCFPTQAQSPSQPHAQLYQQQSYNDDNGNGNGNAQKPKDYDEEEETKDAEEEKHEEEEEEEQKKNMNMNMNMDMDKNKNTNKNESTFVEYEYQFNDRHNFYHELRLKQQQQQQQQRRHHNNACDDGDENRERHFVFDVKFRVLYLSLMSFLGMLFMTLYGRQLYAQFNENYQALYVGYAWFAMASGFIFVIFVLIVLKLNCVGCCRHTHRAANGCPSASTLKSVLLKINFFFLFADIVLIFAYSFASKISDAYDVHERLKLIGNMCMYCAIALVMAIEILNEDSHLRGTTDGAAAGTYAHDLSNPVSNHNANANTNYDTPADDPQQQSISEHGSVRKKATVLHPNDQYYEKHLTHHEYQRISNQQI